MKTHLMISQWPIKRCRSLLANRALSQQSERLIVNAQVMPDLIIPFLGRHNLQRSRCLILPRARDIQHASISELSASLRVENCLAKERKRKTRVVAFKQIDSTFQLLQIRLFVK
ncbi:hypothetical protein D3C78_943260 [compost metagenome]